jgi:hypothetical protein
MLSPNPLKCVCAVENNHVFGWCLLSGYGSFKCEPDNPFFVFDAWVIGCLNQTCLNVGKKLWSCAIAKSPGDCHVMLAIMIVNGIRLILMTTQVVMCDAINVLHSNLGVWHYSPQYICSI